MARTDLIERSKLDTPEDQKAAIFEQLGNLDQYEMLDDEVLMAIYAPSNVLSSGTRSDGSKFQLLTTETQTTEAHWQGKTGLVIKVGPTAFKYMPNGQLYEGIAPGKGDWVIYTVSDARDVHLRGLEHGGRGDFVACRRISSTNIKMRVGDPRCVR